MDWSKEEGDLEDYDFEEEESDFEQTLPLAEMGIEQTK